MCDTRRVFLEMWQVPNLALPLARGAKPRRSAHAQTRGVAVEVAPGRRRFLHLPPLQHAV
jgi:hypothetical protein